jgi:predicted Zn-dependent peptidase
LLIHTIHSNPQTYIDIAASPTTEQAFIQEEIAPLLLDIILPFIEEEWEDDKHACGEQLDNLYQTLAERAANLRRQRQRCGNWIRLQEIADELDAIENELCHISQKFDFYEDDE